MLLSSDIDESAVSALVGSLESQLSSDAHYPRNDLSTPSINNNHITNPTVADCSIRIPDGQKHGALLGSLLEQGSSNTNKNLANSQLLGLNSVSSQNLSNAVIVSLPGALPASGYLTQVSSAQQALLNSSAVGRHVSSNDIKLVYSNQSTASQFSNNVTSTVVTSGVIATNQLSQNNFKVAALHNGNSNFSAGQIVTVTSGGPVISGPQTGTATLSAMQNLANIASQQPRIQVVGGQQTLAQQHLNALSAKGAPPRNQVDPKSKQNSPQLQCSDSNNIQNTQVDHRLSPSSGIPNHYQVLGGPSPVISTKSNQIPGQSINVVTQVVSNPNMLPPSVQIVNVNPARFGQKTLAPRGLVLGNQVRIAPQMIRQGTPISGQVILKFIFTFIFLFIFVWFLYPFAQLYFRHVCIELIL